MTITISNFEKLLLSGHFNNFYLTENEATIAGDWISKNIVAVKRSPDFFNSWSCVNKLAFDPDYLTHLYTCSLSLQYFFDSNIASQTKNLNVINFCIKLLEFIQRNDIEANQITGRQYWVKLSYLYYVKNDYETVLRIINEGIKY